MGGWSDRADTPCPTCKLSMDQGCVGHYGRIKLTEPVFNPFMMTTLVKLMKNCCRNCNKIRMHDAEKENLLRKFQYCRLGFLPPDRVFDKKDGSNLERELDAGNGFDDDNSADTVVRYEDHTYLARSETKAEPSASSSSSSSSPKTSSASQNDSSVAHKLREETWEAKSSDDHRQFAKDLKESVQKADEKKRNKALRQLAKYSHDNSPDRELPKQGTAEFNAALLETYRGLFDYFEKNQPMGKCANCGSLSDKWRKDGWSRVFVTYKDPNTGEQVQNLAIPRMVQKMLEKIWNGEDQELLEYLFPGSRHFGAGKGWELFFMEELLVTPNQFRAPRKTTSEIWQLDHESKCLQAILFACDELKKVAAEKTKNKEGTANQAGGGGSGGGDAGQRQALLDNADASTDPKKLQLQANLEDFAMQNDKAGTLNEGTTGELQQQTTTKSAYQQKIDDTALAKAYVTLQEKVNVYMDGSKGVSKAELESKGIRQKIEKKQGMFRMKMMGKRVNYAGRSVISPEPNVETNEIGVPIFMCKVLGVPERVWQGNLQYCQQLVRNGNDIYPGASQLFVPTADGQRYNVIDLDKLNFDGRNTHAENLSGSATNLDSERPYIVYRNLIDGDPVLMNRQPTLHKPGIMCQVVKVLKKENTLRFHYANCNTYNADFDGDEMNMHAPQDIQGRLEALRIAEADRQYVVPTSGKPLRGIIQDHIAGAVLMMARDTFFTKSDLCQLLYRGLRSQMEKRKSTHWVKMPDLNELTKGVTQSYENAGMEGIGIKTDTRISWPTTFTTPYGPLLIDPPCIIHPEEKWSGKQAFSILLKNLIQLHNGKQQVFHTSKCKTPGDMWNGVFDKNKEEEQILIRNSELLRGVLDKSEFGASAGGLTHLCYEVFGPKMAGAVLSTFARVFTAYLQTRGFTCAMIDALVEKPAEKKRKDLIDETMSKGYDVIDLFVKDHLLPTMRTLPSYAPYDLAARAGGYVTDRFLTGVRPQEFYFHCMAGREGLVDTTVKTSRSGYLQRCLVKHLETCVVAYDGTVRDTSDNSVVQFLYGEDGIDVTKSNYLEKFTQLRENMCSDHQARLRTRNRMQLLQSKGILDMTTAKRYFQVRDLVRKSELKPFAVKSGQPEKAGGLIDKFDTKKAVEELESFMSSYSNPLHDWEGVGVENSATGNFSALEPKLSSVFKRLTQLRRQLQQTKHWKPYDKFDPPQALLNPKQHLGAVSERFHDLLLDFVKKQEWKDESEETDFINFCMLKYQNCLADEGEAVGVLAAQGMGEPSTQMTLNTFHLAGHGGANVTLGIPRLREIVQTASRNIMTPLCKIKVLADQNGSTTLDDKLYFAESVALRYGRTHLHELITEYRVTEKGRQLGGNFVRTYIVELDFVSLADVQKKFPHLNTTEKLNQFLQEGYYSFLGQFKNEVDKYVRAAEKNRNKETATSKRKAVNDEKLRAPMGGGGGGDDESGDEEGGKNESRGKNNKKGNERGDEQEGEGNDMENNDSSNHKKGKKQKTKKHARGLGKKDDSEDDGSDSGSEESSESESEELKQVKDEEDDLLADEKSKKKKHGKEGKTALAGKKASTKTGRGAGNNVSDDSSDSESLSASSDSEMENANRDHKQRKQQKKNTIDDKQAEALLKKKAQKLLRNQQNVGAMIVSTDDSEEGTSDDDTTKKKKKKMKKQQDLLEVDLDLDEDMENQGTLTPVERFLNDAEADNETLEELGKVKFTTPEWFHFPETNRATWAFRMDVSAQKCPCKMLLSEIIKKLSQERYAQDERAKGIKKVNVLQKDDEVTIETEGINLTALWQLPDELSTGELDWNRLNTNCIGTTMDLYGAEAARNAIVREIRNVFGHYGIEVNWRHLYLIADYMTSQGSYRAFSRRGMQDISSPFLQMTYETSLTFAAKAALEHNTDSLASASASIITGKLPTVGTGCFDVLTDFKQFEKNATELGEKLHAEQGNEQLRNRFFDEDSDFGCVSDEEEGDVMGVGRV
ncbi:unnamed protein product [Amoebophrya sp. A120]|nr:unnamed protein product [Amoebophrya sp. A120]|eukprot:GSA120T00023191001.1